MIHWATYVPMPAIIAGWRHHRRLDGPADMFEEWARSHIAYRLVQWPSMALLIPIAATILAIEGLGWLVTKLGEFVAYPMTLREMIAQERTFAYNMNAGKKPAP